MVTWQSSSESSCKVGKAEWDWDCRVWTGCCPSPAAASSTRMSPSLERWVRFYWPEEGQNEVDAVIAPGDISRLLGRGGGKGVVVTKVGLRGGAGQWGWHWALAHLTNVSITSQSLDKHITFFSLTYFFSSLTPLVEPLVLPSGASDVGGRVLAPDLLRSPPEIVIQLKVNSWCCFLFKIPPNSKHTDSFFGEIDEDATHQHHHEQVQKSDQSRQLVEANHRLGRIRRTRCCDCPSALEKSRIPGPPGEEDLYSNFLWSTGAWLK